jgi:hypothetical protein
MWGCFTSFQQASPSEIPAEEQSQFFGKLSVEDLEALLHPSYEADYEKVVAEARMNTVYDPNIPCFRGRVSNLDCEYTMIHARSFFNFIRDSPQMIKVA